MARGPLGADALVDYPRDGYVLARGLFEAREIELLRRAAKEDRALDDHAFGRADGEGGVVRLSLWNHPGDGIYGMFARCRSVVDTCEAILGGEVYHYHSKMVMKEARVGGAWAWHQDYGYWYQNGVLFPDLVSVFVAVDPATRENGCLQVLRGSQLCGRVDHVLTGDQAGADRERVAEIAKRLELVHVEMEPGDALFFHPNLLHRSDQNRSENPRWSLICCYNARRNDPYRESHHPRYTPLAKVDDAAIVEVGLKRFVDAGEVGWLDPARDASARSLAEDGARRGGEASGVGKASGVTEARHPVSSPSSEHRAVEAARSVMEGGIVGPPVLPTAPENTDPGSTPHANIDEQASRR